MEPSNKGHIGASNFVLCTEVVLTSGVKNALELYFGAPLQRGCSAVVSGLYTEVLLFGRISEQECEMCHIVQCSMYVSNELTSLHLPDWTSRIHPSLRVW